MDDGSVISKVRDKRHGVDADAPGKFGRCGCKVKQKYQVREKMTTESPIIEMQEETYPFIIDYLPNEYREKAERELNETSENNASCLEELKLMARSEEETKEIEFHDDFLRQFLRQNKYDVYRSLKRLQAFTKFKRQKEDFFRNVDDEKLSKNPNYKYCTTLPWRCRDGCTITVFEYSKWAPSGIPLEDLMRLGLIMYQQSLRNPMTQINGIKMIVDWKGSNLSQLAYTTPKSLLTAYKAFMICTPARIKEIHMVNESSVMKTIFTFMKPFLSQKLKSRIIFHSLPEGLLNYFPKHVLPTKYGGDFENYYMEDWMIQANEQQRMDTLAGQCNHF